MLWEHVLGTIVSGSVAANFARQIDERWLLASMKCIMGEDRCCRGRKHVFGDLLQDVQYKAASLI